MLKFRKKLNMAASDEQEALMMEKYGAALEEGGALDRLRAHILSKGVKSIRSMGR